MANYVLLETIELTQTASSVVFDLIPQTGYTDLKLVISARSTRGTYAEDGLGIRLNSSTTGYTYKILGGTGGGLYNLDTSYEQTWVCNIPASAATSGVFGSAEAYIPNYTGSFAKSYSVEGNAENNSSTGYMTIGAILQSSTSPISSITLLAQNGNLLVGSTFSLYGVAAVGTTPALAPKATGGNMVSTDGTYWYHTFLTSGYFVPQTSLTNVDYLVVAGGGGTIYQNLGYYAGGGGGGGLRSSVSPTGGGGTAEAKLSFSSNTSYPVIIGAGGAAVGASNRYGVQGNNSSISTITSTGGGYGTYGPGATSANGGNGGSGGGAGSNNGSPYPTYTGGTGTSGQGYNGGSNESTDAYAGGAGGGAGGAGGNANNGKGGTGGAAVSNAISGTATYYAGGGWGGKGYYGSATNGDAGTGFNSYPGTGMGGVATNGSGQSGIVIIRYAMV
jgi:hypothetical protein